MGGAQYLADVPEVPGAIDLIAAGRQARTLARRGHTLSVCPESSTHSLPLLPALKKTERKGQARSLEE